MNNKIQNILISRGCPSHQAETIAHKIENLSAQLKPAMEEWLNNEAKPKMEVDGISTDYLTAHFNGMQYPAALLLLDWVIKDPQTAKKAIEKGIR